MQCNGVYLHTVCTYGWSCYTDSTTASIERHVRDLWVTAKPSQAVYITGLQDKNVTRQSHYYLTHSRKEGGRDIFPHNKLWLQPFCLFFHLYYSFGLKLIHFHNKENGERRSFSTRGIFQWMRAGYVGCSETRENRSCLYCWQAGQSTSPPQPIEPAYRGCLLIACTVRPARRPSRAGQSQGKHRKVESESCVKACDLISEAARGEERGGALYLPSCMPSYSAP